MPFRILLIFPMSGVWSRRMAICISARPGGGRLFVWMLIRFPCAIRWENPEKGRKILFTYSMYKCGAIRFWPPTLLSNACSISIGRDIICIRTTDFLNGNFVYLGNGRFVFSASLKRPEAVVEIDRVDTASCRYFGRKRYADGDWLEARKDNRRIFRQGENIVAYSDDGCFVEKYDPDGRLVDMYDFRQDQPLKGQIKRAEQKEEEERARGQAVVETVAKEAYLYGDCLYVLFFDREGESVSCNRVLVLDVSGEKIIPKNVYRLTGGNFYVSLCADDRYLYAFCCSPEVKIQKFSL